MRRLRRMSVVLSSRYCLITVVKRSKRLLLTTIKRQLRLATISNMCVVYNTCKITMSKFTINNGRRLHTIKQRNMTIRKISNDTSNINRIRSSYLLLAHLRKMLCSLPSIIKKLWVKIAIKWYHHSSRNVNNRWIIRHLSNRLLDENRSARRGASRRWWCSSSRE